MLDIMRNKIMMAYTIFLLVIALSVFNLEDNVSKGILTLLNIILIIIPLISIIFSTIYIYNSSEFIELLVSQPFKRLNLWLSIFIGLSLSMTLAFLVGAGIPILLYHASETGLIMIATGLILSVIFVAIALLTAVNIRDKAKGIGVSILLWVYFTLIYDGIILFVLFQFSDYPMEKILIGFSSINPIDLARILILLKLDISALMGYTGAIFRDFFGSQWGMIYTFFIMLSWAIIPLWLSARKFSRKNL